MSKLKPLCTLAASAGLIVSLTACGSGAGSTTESIAFTMWGGMPQKAHVDHLVTPWADGKGFRVLQDSPTDYAKLTAQVKSGKVSWGVVQVEPNFANNACADGNLERLSDEVKATAKDVGVSEALMGECALPGDYYALTIAYNTDVFAQRHPTTWAEFFDTKQFPGKRGFYKAPGSGMLEAALLADGVKPAELYPLNLDRAFKKLDTIKKDIVFYDSGDQQAQLLSSGEAPLVQGWNGRISLAQRDGEPVANEWGENIGTYEQFVIPKGYPNADAAQEWMVWFLKEAKGQAKVAEITGYSPVTQEALGLLPKAIAGQMSNSPENTAKASVTIDYQYWAEHYAAVTETTNNWAQS